jgi:POT family proton-dependent oligopeptide transporter
MWNIVTLVGVGVTALTIPPVLLQLRNHPRGLFVLFFAEMWERFSYYGMRGILITYMTQHFLFGDETAQGQYGAYTSLVYLMPLIGGYLADKLLGTRKAIAFGALLLVAGHLAMAIEQKPATQHLTYQGQTYDFVAEGRQDQRTVHIKVGEGLYTFGPAADGGLAIAGLPPGAPLPAVLPKGSYETSVSGVIPTFKSIFYLALSLIIMGVGFLKANISSIVGQLYVENDPRRDSGFTLYYYGINMGAFWASILCAGLGLAYGWAWGFGLAGVGMLAGFVVFVRGKPLLEGKGEPPNPEFLKKKIAGPIDREWLTYGLAILGVGVVYMLVQSEPVVNWLLLICAIGVLAYFGMYMATKCTAVEAQRIVLALVLVAASVIFWTLFELAGTALNQFAERNTALPSNGFWSMTSGQTQSFNSGFILLLAPVFAAAWVWLARHKREPNDAMKFALALMQVGAGFLVLVWGAMYADAGAKVPLIFLVLLYLLHTTGELCLSPVGLSAMTKLAPAPVLATMMATWFLASSAAQALGAQISKLTAAETVGGQVLDPHAALTTYVGVFQQIGIGAIVLGVALAAASPWLKKLAHAPESGTGTLPESAEVTEAVKTRAPS